jgi:hypothetical protein
VIAAWSSFALIGAYELLMRQVRRSAAGRGKPQPRKLGPQPDPHCLVDISRNPQVLCEEAVALPASTR